MGRGEELRRHFSPGSKAPAAAVATAAACLPVLQGGFLACQAWEASHADGLETRVYPLLLLLLLRTRGSSTAAVRRAPERLMKRTKFSFLPPTFATLITKKEDFYIYKHRFVFLFSSPDNLSICFPALSGDKFVRAADICCSAAFLILFVSGGEKRKYKRI